MGDEDLVGEKLQEEIERAKAVNQVAMQIVSNGRLVLEAVKTKEEYLNGTGKQMPEMLRESFLITTGNGHGS